MKIYIVLEGTHEGGIFIAAYYNEKKAYEHANRNHLYFYVEEHEVTE